MSSTDLISDVKVCFVFSIQNQYTEEQLHCNNNFLLDVEQCEDDDNLNVTRQMTER